MSLFQSIFGTNSQPNASGLGAAGQQAAQNYYNANAQQAYTQALQNAYASQQIAAQSAFQQQRFMPARWVFDGEICTLTEFADKVFGDTPQKTMFILKHSEDK